MNRTIAAGMMLLASLTAFGCDKGDGTKGADAGGDEEGSALAAGATKNAQEIEAEIEAGEGILFSCAAATGQYAELQAATSGPDKDAWDKLVTACFVKAPERMIADLRAKLKKGELGTFDTVDLETLLEDEHFPKEGRPAEVAKDAEKLLTVEIPTAALVAAVAKAKKEIADGETVSMGCIEGEQVVDDHKKALSGDADGKAALAALAETCKDQ